MSESSRAIPLTARHYQAMCGLALVAIFLVQMERGVSPSGSLFFFISPMLNGILLLAGAILILYRTRSSPLYVFLIMASRQLLEQFDLTRFTQWDPSDFRFMELTDVLLCVAMLTYLVGQYRLHALWFHLVPHDARERPLALVDGGTPAPVPQARSENTMTPAELVWLVVPIPVFAVAAQCCVLWLGQSRHFLEVPPRWNQFLVLAWVVLFLMFASAHAFRYWRRLQMDPKTAQLLLQDVLWNETRGEQRRINRWIVWRKLKRQEEVDE